MLSILRRLTEGFQQQTAQRQQEQNDLNSLSQITDIFRQQAAQQQRNQDDLNARADAAQALQTRRQDSLERKTVISDQVKDVYSHVANIVSRDFNTLGDYLTSFNNDLENSRAHELGLDAPHASVSMAPDLPTHEERWERPPSFEDEEREFRNADRHLLSDDASDIDA